MPLRQHYWNPRTNEACFVDDKLRNVFKHKTKGESVRAQYTFYNYLKNKNETGL